jgi:hypothetical protein
MRRLSVLLVIAAVGLAAACGDGGSSDKLSAQDQDVVAQFEARQATDAVICNSIQAGAPSQLFDAGLGGAARKAIKVLAAHPKANYGGTTLRLGLTSDVQDIAICRPDLAAQLQQLIEAARP